MDEVQRLVAGLNYLRYHNAVRGGLLVKKDEESNGSILVPTDDLALDLEDLTTMESFGWVYDRQFHGWEFVLTGRI